MNALAQSLNVFESGLNGSTAWLRWVNLACLLGLALSALSAALHFGAWRRTRRGETPGRGPMLAGRTLVAVLVASIVAAGFSVANRWVEVNHFPSQTMSEVLVMFSSALLISQLVMHFALRLKNLGPGWALADDAIVALVFAGVWLTNVYSTTLSTAQRDLPPALQSYWFAPHLVALIFSYATLGIAGAVCLVYFCVRFWSGVFSGGRSPLSQALVLGLLVLVPFAQWVTVPVLLLVGAIFLGLKLAGGLPPRTALAGLERDMDQISYKAFAVGIPFLTAGLFMGAFWAQEAWANYWGWDSKENSALITWLVYVGYIHLRMLGGYRGERAMAVLMGGALSVFLTFQVFGYLPDSQKSLHRYTDDAVTPLEGRQGGPLADESARLDDEEKR